MLSTAELARLDTPRMISIPLTQGQFAIVDDVDADLASLKWHATKRKNTSYAARSVRLPGGRKRGEYLHRVIAARIGLISLVSHKDWDGLNCRRDNLQPATKSQNGADRGLDSNNTSGFKGVTWHLRAEKWMAQIEIDGKRRYLGVFVDPADAARAYDRAAVDAFGQFSALNFPVSSC